MQIVYLLHMITRYTRTVSQFFFFNDTATTEIYTLSLHDALPICQVPDNKYRVVHFEEFLENPEHYGKKLSEWWELEHEVVEVGLKNLRKPSGMSKIPGDSRKFLENFFSEARLNQWQEFYNSNKLQIYFLYLQTNHSSGEAVSCAHFTLLFG